MGFFIRNYMRKFAKFTDMSIRTLIEKLLNLFRKKALEIEPEIREVIEKILPVTKEIKEWLEDPFVVTAATYTPVKWDDALRIFGIEVCNWVLSEFEADNIEEFAATTGMCDKPTQHARLMKMNSKFVQKACQVTEHIADSSAQVVFSGLHK